MLKVKERRKKNTSKGEKKWPTMKNEGPDMLLLLYCEKQTETPPTRFKIYFEGDDNVCEEVANVNGVYC